VGRSTWGEGLQRVDYGRRRPGGVGMRTQAERSLRSNGGCNERLGHEELLRQRLLFSDDGTSGVSHRTTVHFRHLAARFDKIQ